MSSRFRTISLIGPAAVAFAAVSITDTDGNPEQQSQTAKNGGDGVRAWIRIGRAVWVTLLVNLLISMASVAIAQECGDADSSGGITLNDGVSVLRAAAQLPSSCSLGNCDTNGDGIISLNDGVNVLRAAAGLAATLSCGASDPFIASVEGPAGVGEFLEIGVAPLPGAPETIDVIAQATGTRPGSTIAFTIRGKETLAVGSVASSHLFVGSKRDGDAVSRGSFVLPFDTAQGEVTVLLDIRDDVSVQQFRVDLATGLESEITGQRISVLIVIITDLPELCGNTALDRDEECDPPGSRTGCSAGAFCNTDCECSLASAAVCGNDVREGAEQCDGPDNANCETPLQCRSDGSCRCSLAFCGNGVLEGSEQCDTSSATACQGRPCTRVCVCAPPTPIPTPTPRFVDNGDGTVTDKQTGLQWEKKTSAVGSGPNISDPHDVDNRYKWCRDVDDANGCDNSQGVAGPRDGPLFTEFLAALNTPPCFAGHCDWRVPTVNQNGDPPELETIVSQGRPGCGNGSTPCIAEAFGPTLAAFYWSATTFAAAQDQAWQVYFLNGGTDYSNRKFDLHAVRAVRNLP